MHELCLRIGFWLLTDYADIKAWLEYIAGPFVVGVIMLGLGILTVKTSLWSLNDD